MRSGDEPFPMKTSDAAAPRPVGLRLIAAFKFIKASVLFAAGFGALKLLSPERSAWVQDWLAGFVLDQGHRLAALLAGRALALARLWPEYLTVAMTIFFLPVEVVAAWHRWTPLRSATIALNVVVVVYLLGQLRSAHRLRADRGR